MANQSQLMTTKRYFFAVLNSTLPLNKMAAQGQPENQIGGYMPPTFPYSNGYDRETAILDSHSDKAQSPSMEDMLKEATDMQTGRTFNSSRLQVQSDENSSPFQHHAPTNISATPNTLQTGPSSHINQPVAYGNQPAGHGNQNPAGTELVKGVDASAKMDALKKWTVSTFKYTKQMVSEKMGRRTRTVDTELEKHIQSLRETQLRYNNLLKLAKQFSLQFQNILVTQKLLGEAFTELSVKSPDLQEEYNQNADLQKVISKSGDTLVSALTFFTENLQTLATKTIDDTIITIREYESARIEYDAYRTDLEAYEAQGQSMKTEEARREFVVQKDKFEKLRNNLQIKMKFLEENKVKVMRKQLLILHNAMAAYFSGNKEELEKTMKEFSVRVMSKGEGTSFLETH